MKRLLLPLLAALALPTAVNAGNLGVADLMLNGLDVREAMKRLEGETSGIIDI